MATRKAGTGSSVGGTRQFDSEIEDMASYVQNYKIDSELAVSDFS